MTTAPPYQPIEGCDTPALQPCFERWLKIEPYLSRRGRVLDLGCHTGWFCRRFASTGWKTLGVDRSQEWVDLARKQHPTGLYVVADVFDIEFLKFDVVLCLSLSMYLFDDLDRGWDLFRRISEAAPMMFMDFGGQYADKLPFTEATVIDQMLGNTIYTSGQLLGRTAFESRPFYIFER